MLVGRDSEKLTELQREIERGGGHAVGVVCDLSDITSVRRAATEILDLHLPIVGSREQCWHQPDASNKECSRVGSSLATNHLGPFVLTEALMPHLPDGANVIFVASGVEDPERKPAKIAGFRGGRYISAEASSRGEWAPGGSKIPGADAYATSKQCTLAAALEFARETPRLRFNAVEPGFSPGTSLHRDANVFLRFPGEIRPHIARSSYQVLEHSEAAAHVITKVLLDESGGTGEYYDEKGQPMLGSVLVRDPKFQDASSLKRAPCWRQFGHR